MLGQGAVFNPFDIDEDVTLESIIDHLKFENYLSALVSAIKLNDGQVI